MTTRLMRPKPWLLVVMLAVFVGGSAGLRPTRLAAQPPEPVIEDEPWVQEMLAFLCAGDVACADAGQIQTALRDCVKLTGHGSVSPNQARNVCGLYGESIRNGSSRSTLEEIERAAFAIAEAEAAALAAAGGIEALTLQLRNGLIPCLLVSQLFGQDLPTGSLRPACPDVYAAVNDIWREATAQAFLFARLADGVAPEQAADELTRYDSCLREQLSAGLRDVWGGADRICRNLVVPAVSGEPLAVTVSCSLRVALPGDAITCTGTVTGPYTSLQWSAPGGSPSTGTEQSLMTRYDVPGEKTIELTACNTVQPDNRQLCTVGRESVRVLEVTPTITALSCTPLQVAVGGVVTCTVSVDNATTRRWSAPGGDLVTGSGASFSTAYAQPGVKTITFRACNGADQFEGQGSVGLNCAEQQRAITVTAAATPTPTRTPTPTPTATACTQFDVSGTWQTSQGNGYNPSFAFQQSGTRISGTATVSSAEAARGNYASNSGSISGTLVGNQLDVTVTWSTRNGPISGRYTAAVAQTSAGQGRLNGGNAGGNSWNGSGPLRCAVSR